LPKVSTCFCCSTLIGGWFVAFQIPAGPPSHTAVTGKLTDATKGSVHYHTTNQHVSYQCYLRKSYLMIFFYVFILKLAFDVTALCLPNTLNHSEIEIVQSLKSTGYWPQSVSIPGRDSDYPGSRAHPAS